MENYFFNKEQAGKVGLVDLFKILYALIEVQRLASIYRATGNYLSLECFGICTNMGNILEDYSKNTALSKIFFKGMDYPITPYNSLDEWTVRSEISYKWGNNPVGNVRIKMLDRMIHDLTKYLTEKA